jgi:hypothetical protein
MTEMPTYRELLDVVAEVARLNPMGTNSMEEPICWFCNVEQPYDVEIPIKHTRKCLWKKVQRLMKSHYASGAMARHG